MLCYFILFIYFLLFFKTTLIKHMATVVFFPSFESEILFYSPGSSLLYFALPVAPHTGLDCREAHFHTFTTKPCCCNTYCTECDLPLSCGNKEGHP